MKRKKLFSIIIPCLNEEGNILPLYNRLEKVFQKIPYEHEYIFVDNDSHDSSEKIFKKLAKKDKKVKVIFMSRNFGSPQPSYLAGLEEMKGDAAILLQGDIQDPPELIPQFINAWEAGNYVVYGVRKKRRGTSSLQNFFYRTFYFIMKKVSYVTIPPDAGDFSLLDRTIVNKLLSMDEYDYFLRFLRAYVGYPQKGIEYIRDARTSGKSSESLFKSIFWAKSFIINFSLKPLEWISQMAFLIMLVTFLMIIVNIISVVVLRNSPRGIPTIVVLILFLGGIQLLCLSVIAEYLAKIFLEVKRRPRYIVKEVLNGSLKKSIS